MKKVGMSISLSIETVVRIEEYTKEHGRSFSRFMERAANYYLDHNPNVSTVSINDSEPPDIIDDVLKEAIKDIPKDTEPPPNDDDTPKKNDFNFDDI